MPEPLLSSTAAAEPHPGPRRDALAGASLRVPGPGERVGPVGLPAPHARAAALPAADTRHRVDVAIPLRCDQASIVYCLAGLHAQHLRPRRIVFVDDGAQRDGTLVLAREFAASNGFALELRCVPPGGGLTAIADLFDGEALLVLDGGTVLDSPDYLERCLRVLQADPEAAAVGGAVLPLRDEDRRAWARSDAFRRWVGNDDYRDPCAPRGDLQRVGRWIADAYRESVALVRQCLPRRRRMSGPGGALPPAGATLYRRGALAPGGAPADPATGLRADAASRVADGWIVQRPEVRARVQPSALAAPRHRPRTTPSRTGTGQADSPSGLWSAVDPAAAGYGAWFRAPSPMHPARPGPVQGLVLPALAMALLLVGGWRWLAGVALVELALWLSVLAVVAPSRPLATLARGLLVAPLRYVGIAADAAGALRGLVARPR